MHSGFELQGDALEASKDIISGQSDSASKTRRGWGYWIGYFAVASGFFVLRAWLIVLGGPVGVDMQLESTMRYDRIQWPEELDGVSLALAERLALGKMLALAEGQDAHLQPAAMHESFASSSSAPEKYLPKERYELLHLRLLLKTPWWGARSLDAKHFELRRNGFKARPLHIALVPADDDQPTRPPELEDQRFKVRLTPGETVPVDLFFEVPKDAGLTLRTLPRQELGWNDELWIRLLDSDPFPHFWIAEVG